MLYMTSAIFFLEQYIPDKFYIQRLYTCDGSMNINEYEQKQWPFNGSLA